MGDAIAEFGARVPGVIYRERPGAYAVIRGAAGLIAVCEDAGRFFLPGGGIEAGETAEAALRREVAEETGLSIAVEQELGVAAQWLFAAEEKAYFRKVGQFFLARVVAQEPGGEHALHWVTPAMARERLCEEYQRWAVGR